VLPQAGQLSAIILCCFDASYFNQAVAVFPAAYPCFSLCCADAYGLQVRADLAPVLSLTHSLTQILTSAYPCCVSPAGCGLPPGPYGLLGAAEGISYLTVLGFAGAGAAARGASGGKEGLPGALKVPEVLAYGALAAGLFVLASQVRVCG
jgi:hypothetical protein